MSGRGFAFPWGVARLILCAALWRQGRPIAVDGHDDLPFLAALFALALGETT